MSRLFILAKLLCLKVEDIVRYEFLHVMRWIKVGNGHRLLCGFF
jgi:hypothetical protein